MAGPELGSPSQWYRAPVRRLRLGGSVLVAALAGAASAGASEGCPATERYSSCIDANALWLRPGLARFSSVAPARIAGGPLGIRSGLGVLERPLVLEAAAPAGTRELRLVERTIDHHLLLNFRLEGDFELGVALTTVLHQRGTGPDAIRSQSGAPLPRSGVRDPRLGLARALLDTPSAAVAARFELALPLGERDAYTSNGRITAAPGVASELVLGPVTLGVELGARLRRSVELGSMRHGSELYAALGASVRLASEVRASLEAFGLPSLVASTSARARELDRSTRSLPAEWLLGLRWGERSPGANAALACGSGLPLSSMGEGRRGLAPTSPRFRALFELGYAY